MEGFKIGENEDNSRIGNSFLDKDLDAALDSFDNLFCRRCLVSFHLAYVHSFVVLHCFFLSFF